MTTIDTASRTLTNTAFRTFLNVIAFNIKEAAWHIFWLVDTFLYYTVKYPWWWANDKVTEVSIENLILGGLTIIMIISIAGSQICLYLIMY